MSEWISVEDKLPDAINVTLIITDGFQVFTGFLSSMHEWCFNSQDTCEECDFWVTHYMPLPNPPELLK